MALIFAPGIFASLNIANSDLLPELMYFSVNSKIFNPLSLYSLKKSMSHSKSTFTELLI